MKLPKPLFHRKADPWMYSSYLLWRWFDIVPGGVLYLRRLYLFRCPLFSVMLHRIHRPDPDRYPHDHPHNFISFVLFGHYFEEVNGIEVRRKWFNYKKACTPHRITKVSKNCMTLVLAGSKIRSWGFHTPDKWVYWKEYMQ